MSAALEKSGFVLVTDDDEILPARDIGRICVQEILEVARNQRSEHFAPRALPIPAVDRLTASLDEMRRARCGDLSLRDLVEETPRPMLVARSGAPGNQVS
jgi:hypothetical protein